MTENTQAVNLENLRENSMGDEEFMLDLISLFVSQAKEQLDVLETICTDGTSHDWVEISHALKGTAGAVGADEMRELCAKSQDMETASSAERREIYNDIHEQYNRATRYLIENGYYEE